MSWMNVGLLFGVAAEHAVVFVFQKAAANQYLLFLITSPCTVRKPPGAR
jgi:hypothetical protein